MVARGSRRLLLLLIALYTLSSIGPTGLSLPEGRPLVTAAPDFPTVVFADQPSRFPVQLEGAVAGAGIALCTWAWGDGTAPSSAPCNRPPWKSYAALPTHLNSVRLTVSASLLASGAESSFSATVIVLPASTVTLGGSRLLISAQLLILPSEPDAEQMPRFQPMVLALPLPAEQAAPDLSQQLPLFCLWDFGDGTSSAAGPCNPTYHHYQQPNPSEGYPVTLTVGWAGVGQLAQVTTRLAVRQPSLRRRLRLPGAAVHLDFQVNPSFARVGQSVSFIPEASTLGVISLASQLLHLPQSPPGQGCLWEFGDLPRPGFPQPITLCSAPVFHVYRRPGSYRAELTLMLEQDSPVSLAHRVEVSGSSGAPPPASAAPESVARLIARAVAEDPAGVRNPDELIGDREIVLAMTLWTTGRSLPGATNLVIDDRSMIQLVALWSQGAPVR